MKRKVSLPHRVAALHGGVERTDAGLVAMDEPAVDVDDQVAIFFVKALEHDISLLRGYRCVADGDRCRYTNCDGAV